MTEFGRFDFIVVGAGSAGCVVAARLSEDPRVRVLLIEAGPKPTSPWVRIPAGTSRLIFPGPHNWGYSTEAEPHLNGRSIYLPRGRGLGGSSLINGMGFVRGNPADYDSWADLGNDGWAWPDVLPYFRRLEDFTGPVGGEPLRGSGGPVQVSLPRYVHPATLEFVAAARATGMEELADFNGERQLGVGLLQFNMRDGRRDSSDAAYLTPARGRDNLTVMTDALVHRIHIVQGKAAAVSFERGGTLQTAWADSEIILSAGAIATPKLLMLSGVGPGAALQEMGVEVNLDLPGVGANLQDHLYIHYTSRVKKAFSANAELRGLTALRHGIRYFLDHKGPLTMAASQAAAFVPLAASSGAPDLQVNFRPVSWTFHPSGTLEIGAEPEVTASCCPLHPASRGTVLLRSPRPADAPRVFANYLATDGDQATAVAGLKLMRRIFNTEPLRSHVEAEVAPGPAVGSDAELLDFIRGFAQSMHHWVGTCRMGRDATAVVDSRLRVRGVDGLRIIDASVMPLLPSGNTNAPVLMIGEKGADLVRQDARS